MDSVPKADLVAKDLEDKVDLVLKADLVAKDLEDRMDSAPVASVDLEAKEDLEAAKDDSPAEGRGAAGNLKTPENTEIK